MTLSHVPHELAEEFPDDHAILHALKVADGNFAHLSDTYHEINRRIHRIESLIEPATDETLNELRRQRVVLKDEIAANIAAQKRDVA
ncbi:YdcH family protein [Oharaeibacter diazotrophicus]|uniref:DUF465 domain-containing protein n=1 Tax=Oharaeibacter diazotrophicus TaxID=1920512 RepID=A0A4R6RC28_9HYPH|nr:hypothetical protein EDD54_3174 [Oharaeibacter diazotrophicus]BBE72047.1 hypothetical protein OHA_1_01634 [Pleomorphomonas sp. SM30]GLS78812.1 hypothetical protein GCM10007904_41490 [Oharaeibacter diazotrophicus]